MKFVMGGRVFILEELDTAMNAAFLDLHRAYFSEYPLDWRNFEAAALEFFDGAGASSSAQDAFFNNFTVIWRSLLNSGRLDEAESLWQMAVQLALTWERQHPGRFIHKGTPFYFWGMTAILRGDLDRGYALMHQAVEEDVRTSGSRYPDTPAFALVTLNYAKADQAFRGWVLLQAEFLAKLIKEYSVSYDGQLTLDEFRRRFLQNPPDRDTVFLFAYVLARLLRLKEVPDYALSNAFAAQLEMNLLFGIVLVIDSAIRAKNPAKEKLIDHIAYLSRKAKLGLSKKQLRELNRRFRSDFDSTLSELLDGRFRFADGSVPPVRATDLAITYGLRNRAAHDMSSVPTIWQEFRKICQGLFNVLFLCVEVLY